jgi:MFS family permease
MTATTTERALPRLGLRENWGQFSILLLVNAFVGGMVGLERTVVPLIGAEEFKIAATTTITAFVASFGLAKALTNLASGVLADVLGRKRVLVAGWAIALPVPFLIMWAPSWNWIIVANILLGISQGLTWSMAVVMKIDLVGPKSRGLAIGLNECSGYLMVGATAFLTGWIAAETGVLRPDPILPGIAYAALGLTLSALLVRDTSAHLRLEAQTHGAQPPVSFREVFLHTSLRDRNSFAASQAGLINNLNDGLSWAIFPLFFATRGLGIESIGLLKAVYPAVWGVMQVVTGPLSDRIGRKGLIAAGMWLQAIALFIVAGGRDFQTWFTASLLLGLGTAMVYPALLAVVSDAAHPSWRARSLSVYRFWRDLGYTVGALVAGFLSEAAGFAGAIVGVGMLTLFSGVIVAFVMQDMATDDERRKAQSGENARES